MRLDDVLVPRHDRAGRRRRIDPRRHRVRVVVVRSDRSRRSRLVPRRSCRSRRCRRRLNEALAVEARRLPDSARPRGLALARSRRHAERTSSVAWPPAARRPGREIAVERVVRHQAARRPHATGVDLSSERSHSFCARATSGCKLRERGGRRPPAPRRAASASASCSGSGAFDVRRRVADAPRLAVLGHVVEVREELVVLLLRESDRTCGCGSARSRPSGPGTPWTSCPRDRRRIRPAYSSGMMPPSELPR